MGALNLIVFPILASIIIEAQTASIATKNQVPDIVYIEILCVVDYSTYIFHNKNDTAIKEYFSIFWNGVDLRFKVLEDPQIRISLAGIFILKTKEEAAFVEKNRIKADGIDIHVDQCLDDMAKFLYAKKNSLPHYDVAVTITKLNMLSKTGDEEFDPDTIGLAYEGRVCFIDEISKAVRSAAIVEDSGAFSGINGAIHEIGHLLNGAHDGDEAMKYAGGPGATRCSWEDGFIMGEATLTQNGFKWSQCSIEAIQYFMKQNFTSCLRDVPGKSEKLSQILPGKVAPLEQQCFKLNGGSPCFEDQRVCQDLFCANKTISQSCEAMIPAADGSPCGPGMHCFFGQCVDEKSPQ